MPLKAGERLEVMIERRGKGGDRGAVLARDLRVAVEMLDEQPVEALLALQDRSDQAPDQPVQAAAPAATQIDGLVRQQAPALVERVQPVLVEVGRRPRQLGPRRGGRGVDRRQRVVVQPVGLGA